MTEPYLIPAPAIRTTNTGSLKRDSSIWTVRCPYRCGRNTHTHGAGDGPRVPHCGGSGLDHDQYWVVDTDQLPDLPSQPWPYVVQEWMRTGGGRGLPQGLRRWMWREVVRWRVAVAQGEDW